MLPAMPRCCFKVRPPGVDDFTTGAGRTALISTTGVPGWSGGPDATIEGLRDHWSEVVDPDGSIPMTYSRDDLKFYTGPATWRD